MMEFIETSGFERTAAALLGEDGVADLQTALMLRPEMGPVIPASGSLRKLRWAAKGKGKRGGARVIYYWMKDASTIYLIYAYAKNRKEDLTRDELKILRHTIED
jgi:hypothetical protein